MVWYGLVIGHDYIKVGFVVWESYEFEMFWVLLKLLSGT
jgi:hypothetical protein